jgi:hypothetical protein
MNRDHPLSPANRQYCTATHRFTTRQHRHAQGPTAKLCRFEWSAQLCGEPIVCVKGVHSASHVCDGGVAIGSMAAHWRVLELATGKPPACGDVRESQQLSLMRAHEHLAVEA